MRKNNRFGHRFGQPSVFLCGVCERRTRMAGQGNEELCRECWELAGLQNSVFDLGWDLANKGGGLVIVRDKLLKSATKRGSDPDKIRAEFPELFPEKKE